MTIAVFATKQKRGGHGIVLGLAGAGIERATGWRPAEPLNGQRCLTRAAFEAARPLADGWGAETGLTIDLLRQGMRVTEVEVPLTHRATGKDLHSQLHRAHQLADVARALASPQALADRPAPRRRAEAPPGSQKARDAPGQPRRRRWSTRNGPIRIRPGGSAGPGLALTGVSFALTVTVALLGPSLMEPALPGQAGQPPWSLSAHPSPYLVVALSGAAIITAIIGLIFSFNALRRSWPGPARLIMWAGIAGAVVLAFLPPFGSSDHLSYAAYGRMAITGHDPFTTTPAMLARLGDPVARAVQDWRTSPSVYGPVAIAGQAFAAWIGGTSVRLIVFVLSALNVAAFAGTGLILHWLARGDRGPSAAGCAAVDG